ncbi:MAG: GxxExxY protein [Planctomycetota bacterium]|nr:GxxExxY protein [Planctomycetota bacterium]
MAELIYAGESYAIMGACFAVHNEMGCGFTESVYQECLAIELQEKGIPFLAQPELELEYRGRTLQQHFRPDFVCYGSIILEIKALASLVDEHKAQVLNYLNATGYRLGLLVNFGTHPKLQSERIPFTPKGTANE